ncbi:MAG: hypothetical protein ABI995_14650, partial [Acidobacteriota bacterium]
AAVSRIFLARTFGIVIVAALSAPAFAQKVISAKAGSIYYSEGAIAIDGLSVRASGTDRRPQLQDGQILTTPGGHAEVLMGAGAILWVAGQSTVKFEDTRVEDARVELEQGALMVEVKTVPAGSHLRFLLGGTATDLNRVGLYRFDASTAQGSSARIRVYEGVASLGGAGEKDSLREGQQATLGSRAEIKKLNRKEVDDFHYWSALRSYQLETESGARKKWKPGDSWYFKNSSFGVQFPSRPQGAARAMYLAAGEAGLVNLLDGSGVLGRADLNKRIRTPFRLGSDNSLTMDKDGRAEVFLGLGVVARIGANSKLRMIDTMAGNPVVALDEGSLVVEVASTDQATVHVRVGDSVTELLKAGVYRFDAKEGSLMVYGGESSTLIADDTEHARTGQIVNLREAVTPAKFDLQWQDALFKWSAARSFQLYTSSAWFMADWSESATGGKFKHKQYGERTGRGGPPQLRTRRG